MKTLSLKFIAMSMVGAVALFSGLQLDAASITPQRDAAKGLWGFVNASGKWIMKPKFDTAQPFAKRPNGAETSEVTLKGLTGFVDENGKLLGPGVVFEQVKELDDDALLVRVKGKYGIVNNNCVYIVKPDLTSVEDSGDGRLLVALKDKRGLLDRKGTYVLPIEYETVYLTVPGFIRVVKGSKVGLMDRDGNVKIAPDQYLAIEPFGATYWKVIKGDKTGLYDVAAGRLLVKPDYGDVGEPALIQGALYFPVCKNGRWGLIDGVGKELLSCSNQSLEPIRDMNMFLVTTAGNRQLLWFPKENASIDVTMEGVQKVGPFTFRPGRLSRPSGSVEQMLYANFPMGRIGLVIDASGAVVSSSAERVEQNGRFILVTSASGMDVYDADGGKLASGVTAGPSMKDGWVLFGNKALSPDNTVYPYKNEGQRIVLAKPSGKWSLLDNGYVGSKEYDFVGADETNSKLIHLNSGGKWGMLLSDNTLIDCTYPKKLSYSEELKGFSIDEDGKKGLMGLDGTKKIEPKYDEISYMPDDEVYAVTLNGKHGFLKNDGATLVEPKYDEVKFYPSYEFFWVQLDGKVGMCNLEGREVLAPEYASVAATGIGDNFWVGKDSRYGVCDSQGNILIPIQWKDSELTTIEDRYYMVVPNGSSRARRYYRSDGTELQQERKIIVTSQDLEHNHYDKNGNKGLKICFTIDTQFLLNEPIYVEAQIFKSNGTPARKSNGESIKWGYWLSAPRYLFASYNGDNWITFPYAQFEQPRGTKRDYFIRLAFRDGSGRTLPIKGNEKISFYLTR